MSLYQDLKDRNFIYDMTHDELVKKVDEEKLTLYCGFDPTADSLTVGNLLPIMAMAWFQKAGHKVILLVGGATGMVGDPSGKSDERSLLTAEQVAHNAACIKKQVSRFLDFDGDNAALMVDNNDWIGKMSFIDWLRDVGKFFNLNHMLAKESVKGRLNSDSGISYTEFSYMTLQAYDFSYLHKEYGCNLQIGGQDQWGNITAGIDLTRKNHQATVYGLTFPLLTNANGEKWGKSMGNSVWLDANRTSPYNFYQFWINTPDSEMRKLLQYFSFMSISEIDEVMSAHDEEPHRRIAQKKLAEVMTTLVHAEEGLAKALKATEVLFGGSMEGLSDQELIEIFSNVPSIVKSKSELEEGIGLLSLMKDAGFSNSIGEARRLVQGGAIKFNNTEKVSDHELLVKAEHLITESCIVIGTKKKKFLVRFEA